MFSSSAPVSEEKPVSPAAVESDAKSVAQESVKEAEAAPTPPAVSKPLSLWSQSD